MTEQLLERLGKRPPDPHWKAPAEERNAAYALIREWNERQQRITLEESQSMRTCPLIDPRALAARVIVGWSGKRAPCCLQCGNDLPPRRLSWCSDDCWHLYYGNHRWNSASDLRVRTDGYRCVRCGDRAGAGRFHWTGGGRVECWDMACPGPWHEMRQGRLQVDHIIPREGRGYGDGCHHHQANLQTLCVPCHAIAGVVRRAIAEAFRRAAAIALPPGALPMAELFPISLWDAA